MNTKSEKKVIDVSKLDVSIREINFKEILESNLNAQEMDKKDFNRLVQNLKRDGCLTSAPLVCDNGGKITCISGHHRIKAALKAGISKANCLVIKDIDESTRIRLQLSHNDIHGEPNKDIVAILLNRLNQVDISLVDSENIERATAELQEININVPKFCYINICLVEQSRNDLVDLIMSLEKSDAVNWFVDKPQYEDVKDLLTYAFDKGFKTPGQAFGKFLEIIKDNKDLIKRK